MKIKTVTITGADDSVEPEALLELSKEFPFVEWGILLSKNHTNRKRFPSREWLFELCRIFIDSRNDIKTSGHICGQWVKELLVGNTVNIEDHFGSILLMFRRMQINTHAEIHTLNKELFLNSLKKLNKETIIQFDDVNNNLYYLAREAGIDVSPLFDLSHGAGILPEEWPAPITEYCGYSGGLGPSNLAEQLRKIETKVDDKTMWIDMETQVRSNNDILFDLKKVRKCLEIVQEYKL